MPQIETLYLVHHSHTDVGYTHDQPIVWELHTRFIDEALCFRTWEGTLQCDWVEGHVTAIMSSSWRCTGSVDLVFSR